jgi:hypothetical protein
MSEPEWEEPSEDGAGEEREPGPAWDLDTEVDEPDE